MPREYGKRYNRKEIKDRIGKIKEHLSINRAERPVEPPAPKLSKKEISKMVVEKIEPVMDKFGSTVVVPYREEVYKPEEPVVSVVIRDAAIVPVEELKAEEQQISAMVEEPKVEEPKVEEHKVEEPKVEEPEEEQEEEREEGEDKHQRRRGRKRKYRIEDAEDKTKVYGKVDSPVAMAYAQDAKKASYVYADGVSPVNMQGIAPNGGGFSSNK